MASVNDMQVKIEILDEEVNLIPELKAMLYIGRALEVLDEKEIERVLAWTNQRFGKPAYLR